jgi:hypothetical protein
MIRFRRLAWCLVACTLLLAVPATVAHAQSLAAPTRQADVTNGHLTVIVLDMSGSMSTNDPQGLRCSAANAYIDLSGSNPTEATNDVGIIGLANDNASGPSGGAHGFRLAQVWAQPTPTNTLANRQALRQIITSKSNGCAPNGNTPTYDALVKAYGMLTTFLGANPTLTGSVILLTDGNPDPQGDTQVADVNKEIVPQFVAKSWPVDTIALGTDTSYRGFLSGISAKTHGVAYDDSQGPVHAVSPLNLARVFADIFKEYEGRALQSAITPTQVNGSIAKQFYIGDAVTHLDAVAVKDTPGTTITLTDPNGQVFQPDQQNNFISQDPHYYIFSLEAHAPAPFLQNGPWTLNVKGSGLFLLDSLTVSTLALNVTAPQDGATLPLGQPITLSATVSENGTIVVDKTYDVEALITPPSGSALRVFLKDPSATGTYSGTFTLPLSAPTGQYTIDATATQGTVSAGEQTLGVKFALFPTAALFGPNGQPILPTTPATCKPGDATTNCTLASGPVSAKLAAWDGGLQFVYTRIPFFASSLIGWHPRDWPLAGYSFAPAATLPGEVVVGSGVNLKTYPNATVTATATRSDGKTLDVTVQNLPNGQFLLHFPPNAQGDYTVTLTTTGNPQDAFGSPVAVTAPIQVSIGGAPAGAERRAWLITGFYLALLALIALFGVYGPINYALRAKPTRRMQLVDTRPSVGTDPVRPLIWRSWTLGRYFAPHRLPAGQVGLPKNLLFRFSYGNVALRVRPALLQKNGALWKLNGRALTAKDGRQALVTDDLITVTDGGQTKEYRFERLKRSGSKVYTTPKAPKPAQAANPPRNQGNVAVPPRTPIGTP